MSDGACYATRGFWRKPPTWPRGCRRVPITLEDRGRFLLEYINLLTTERAHRRGCSDAASVASPPDPIARSMGHQQGPRIGVLVHQGARRRLASPDRHQQRRIIACPARSHRQLLFRARPHQVGSGRSLGPPVAPSATCRYWKRRVHSIETHRCWLPSPSCCSLPRPRPRRRLTAGQIPPRFASASVRCG